MSDLVGNHIVGFSTRWFIFPYQVVASQKEILPGYCLRVKPQSSTAQPGPLSPHRCPSGEMGFPWERPLDLLNTVSRSQTGTKYRGWLLGQQIHGTLWKLEIFLSLILGVWLNFSNFYHERSQVKQVVETYRSSSMSEGSLILNGKAPRFQSIRSTADLDEVSPG